jgi:hypothetical protein
MAKPCHLHTHVASSCPAGVQQLVAVEYRHCPALGLLMPAGIKLLLVNPAVRRGMLLLQPENVVVLGGVVSCLVACSQPPTGRCCMLLFLSQSGGA